MTPQPRLRLLIADHDSLRGGGQLGLTRYLRGDSRFDRSVLTMADGIVAAMARDRGLNNAVVPPAGGPFGLLRTLLSLRRAISRSQPDVVLTNSLRMANLLSLSLKRRRGTPKYIAYLREDLSSQNLGFLKRRFMALVTIPRCDGLLANSTWTASTVPPLFRRPMRIAYPVSGIVARPPRRLSPQDEPLRVLSLSRLAEWKGIHVLVAACALLQSKGLERRLIVTIAGEGDADDPYVTRLRASAAEVDVDISFVGHVEDVDQLLKAHDVLAHCSIRPEAYGQVIPQALSHGLVVIATNDGGPAEMIDHDVSGLLVAPNSALELASALRGLIDERGRADVLAAEGQASSLRYQDIRTISDFEIAVEDLVSSTS